jgi:hypothetical protein
MDEPRIAKTQGLDLVLTPQRDGRVQAELLDEQGETLFTNTYANENSAQSSVRGWLKKRYQAEQITSTPKPKPRPRSLGPGTAAMIEMMDARADDNELQALAKRQEAEALETEAKRLRAALEVLRGDTDGL